MTAIDGQASWFRGFELFVSVKMLGPVSRIPFRESIGPSRAEDPRA
jgi:hypothetical protein